MLLADILDHVSLHFLHAVLLIDHDRADTDDAEHMPQHVNCLIIIPVTAAVDINSSADLCHFELSVDPLQQCADPLRERIFKQVAVVAFDADLAVFDHK